MKRALAMGLLVVMTGCGSGGGDDDADSGTTIDGSVVTTDGGGGGDDAAIVPGPALIGLSAGYHSTCAVLMDKTVKCWGDNREGQLGNGMIVSSTKPVVVTGLANVKSVSVGYEHACAVIEGGTAKCWGRNGSGQLGNNTKVDSEVPIDVMGLTGVTQIQAGVYISCALLSGGTVSCWGRGGDIGDGLTGESLVPKQVPGLTGVMQLSVSSNAGRSSNIHACGVRTGGTAFCWGGNDVGQLGTGNQNPSRVPVDVMNITDAIEITAGGGHACARRTSGLFCWGFGEEIGDGNFDMDLLPKAVTTTMMVNSLSAGNAQTLARTTAGSLICWGSGTRGQCGDGAAFTIGQPVYLMPSTTMLSNVALFSAGGTHGCAHSTAGITTCWGTNEYGEMGSGTPSSLTRISTPTAVVW